tara:strand:+ start:1803 stop:2621 length:819 start_codon:yes stop_codon:yes gene_type:complete
MKTAAVVVGRNDNYGENLHHRAKLCMDNLTSKFDKVFYVDWKTLEVTLIEACGIKKDNIEVISVTKEYIAKQYPQYINYPIVESIGRNIGIRSAIEQGYDWILSTNIDCLVDDVKWSELDKATLYTARRRNVPTDYHLNNLISIDALKSQKHIFNQAQLSVINGQSVWDEGDVWSLVVCCGDFQLAHKTLWSDIKGFEEAAGGRAYTDTNLMKRPIMIGSHTAILDIDIFHLDHTNTSFRLPEEKLPLNDMHTYVREFKKSKNTKDWGKILL